MFWSITIVTKYNYNNILFAFQDASTLITALCLNIKPAEEFLAAKISHLINCILTKQNLQFDIDYMGKVISWHVECLRKCSDVILPDILHNMQCILQSSPQAGYKVCPVKMSFNIYPLSYLSSQHALTTLR